MTKGSNQKDRYLLSLLLMAITAASFSTMGAMAKVLGSSMPAYQVAFFRAAINLLIIIAILSLRHELKSIFFNPRKYTLVLIVRGVFGMGSVVSGFYALAHLPFAIATLIAWLAPLFTCLLSWLFLGEKLVARQIGCIGVAFAGFILMVGTGFSGGTLEAQAISIGVFGAFCAGVAYVSVRKAAEHSSAEVVVCYFVGITSLCLLPVCAERWAADGIHQFTQPPIISALLALGLSGAIGQIAMTHAYRFAPAGPVSVMGLLTPTFAVLIGYLAFNEHLALIQWIGGLAVCAGVLGVSRSKARLKPAGRSGSAEPDLSGALA